MDTTRTNTSVDTRLDYTVNYHLLWQCNFNCNYCFATFDDQRGIFRKGMLPKVEMLRLVDRLSLGFRKITFAGGEPTLCPWIGELIKLAKGNGCLTNLVSNGSRICPQFLEDQAGQLDFLTLSIDTSDPARHERIGRTEKSSGEAVPTERYFEIAQLAKEFGIGVKVNTVVSQINWDDDLTGLIHGISPIRWKLLQAMPVEGQNDEYIAKMTPASWQFESFVSNHDPERFPGIRIVPEPIDIIRGSYVMVDPQGRFFDSTAGGHRYSRPILGTSIVSAMREINFDARKFDQRAGSADWVTSADIPEFAAITLP